MKMHASDSLKTMKNLGKTMVFQGFYEINIFIVFPPLAPISGNSSPLFSPKDLIWPPLGPSWRHLWLPLALLGATLEPLGLPLAVPWPPLKPILATWDP